MDAFETTTEVLYPGSTDGKTPFYQSSLRSIYIVEIAVAVGASLSSNRLTVQPPVVSAYSCVEDARNFQLASSFRH